MSLILTLAKLFSPNFQAVAKQSNKIQLVSIGFSHYCELSSWCLKTTGLPFKEHFYAPGEHVLPALSLRVGDKSQKHLSSSSRMTEVLPTNLSESELSAKATKEAKRDRMARSTAVPFAVAPDGSVWKDSWEIATKTGLQDIDPSLKTILDEKIGVYSRQLAYHYILQSRNNNIWNKLLTYETGFVWKILWWLFVGSYLKKMMIKLMKPFDNEAVAECKVQLNNALQELDGIIAAKKTPFLGGQSIGVADIAVSALVGPIVNPPNYCNGRYTPVFEELMAQDDELRKEVERLRATPTGIFVMDMYAKHR